MSCTCPSAPRGVVWHAPRHRGSKRRRAHVRPLLVTAVRGLCGAVRHAAGGPRLQVSTACLDEVSGIEVAKLVLVIMGLTWTALLAATWQRGKVELVRRPAEPDDSPDDSPDAVDDSADTDGSSADDSRPSSPSVAGGQST